MIEVLERVISQGSSLIKEAMEKGIMKTMYIDYHKPYVSRIWFPFEDQYRVYLHKIEPCEDHLEALFHPHPWQSAIYIVKGWYEMGIGHSSTNEVPVTDCRLIVGPGTKYEMTEKDAWHYVRPIKTPVISLMVTGNLNHREMPVEPNKEFRELTQEEINDILVWFL